LSRVTTPMNSLTNLILSESFREFMKILMEGNNINKLTNEFSYIGDFREFKKILMEDNNTDKLTNLVLLKSLREFGKLLV